MSVRTKRLAVGSSTDAVFKTIYTCPAGRTAIVKDARMQALGAGNTRAIISVRSGSVAVYIFDVALQAGQFQATGLFIVLEPGDDMQVYTTGFNANYRVSGSELAGVAP